MNFFKSKVPVKRDVYLAYLIDGAPRTEGKGYPIIPEEFCYRGIPSDIAQWDRRTQIKDPEKTAMSFYCNDEWFQPVLSNPKAYVESLRKYQCVIGMDCSPFDNMPQVVQDHQIWLNLAITYYYGSQGIKVIPNVRLGGNETTDSLKAYPKHVVIAIGTNGFTKDLRNRDIFMNQVSRVVDEIEPSAIVVYGPTDETVFVNPRLKGIPIYKFDSFMRRRYVSQKNKKGGDCNEGK